MTSKVLVKLPTVPFSQGKKQSPERIPLINRNENTPQSKQHGLNGDRAAQLEQNMKFLQEQHQATLVALHQEVETLRQRNRDLQFQLVYSKSSNGSTNSPSSPEDSGLAKSKGSPVNATSLQVELLEKDLHDLKISLQEAKTHNQHLSEIIERQNKKLEKSEGQKSSTKAIDASVQVGGGGSPAEARKDDLTARLEDAEALVKCLRKENEDQRREIACAKSNPGNSNSSRSRRGNRNGNAQSASSHDRQESNKFPPLHTQSYWHRGSKQSHSYEPKRECHSMDYSKVMSRQDDRQDYEAAAVDSSGSSLPQLHNKSSKKRGESTANNYSPFYRSRGYHHNNVSNNYYRDNGSRNYRGQRTHHNNPENKRQQDHRQEYSGGQSYAPREVAENSRERNDYPGFSGESSRNYGKSSRH